MKDFLLIAYCLSVLGFVFYVIYSRLIELIQQKRADDIRKAYQARKAAVECQALQRLGTSKNLDVFTFDF